MTWRNWAGVAVGVGLLIALWTAAAPRHFIDGFARGLLSVAAGALIGRYGPPIYRDLRDRAWFRLRWLRTRRNGRTGRAYADGKVSVWWGPLVKHDDAPPPISCRMCNGTGIDTSEYGHGCSWQCQTCGGTGIAPKEGG